MKKGRGVEIYPGPFAYPIFTLVLARCGSLLNGLRARRRNRAFFGDVAAGEVYVVSLGLVLHHSLLVGNVASVDKLLVGRTGVDVVATVAEAKRWRSLAAGDPPLGE